MPAKCRLISAIAACLLLSNCGLIGTALRLAPYALLFADESSKDTAAGKTPEMRGQEVQSKAERGILPASGGLGSQVAFRY
jgi:hypothetical protein